MMKSARALFLILAVGAVLSAAVYARFGDVAYNGDALYDAQVARNVVAGKGYVTSEMPLYAVDLYHSLGLSLTPPWYNAHKFPLPVYVKAAFIRLFGDSLASVTFLYSAFFYLLLGIAVFAFARLVWRGRPAFALLASLLVLLNPVLGFGTPYLMVSGLNLLTDSFLFVCIAISLYVWQERRTLVPLIIAGLLSGVAVLDRYNSGLYLIVVIGLLAITLLKHSGKSDARRTRIKAFTVSVAAYLASFIVVVTPFLVSTFVRTGQPFLSINGLFQLLFDTRFNSFIDPWYKLEYVFSTASPWTFALMHPTVLAVKWVKYAALDVIRFISFEGVLWWTALIAAFYLCARLDTDRPVVGNIRIVLKWTLILAVLQALLLPLWAGSIAYFFYLFPLFSLPIAYMLIRSYDALVSISASRTLAKPLGEIRRTFERQAAGHFMTVFGAVALVLISLLLLAYQVVAPLVAGISPQSYLVAGLALVVAAGIFALSYVAPRLFLPAVLTLSVLFFVAQSGLATAPTESAIAAARWDIEERPQTIASLLSFNRGGVSLSATPWNTVWWSKNKLASLPIPEYPDEIYVLSKKYGIPVDSIYLHKIDLYPIKYASYAWSGYQRAVAYGYPFEGFSVANQVADGMVLDRTSAPFSWPTTEIDPGNPAASSHLVWGWGEATTIDGRSAAPIGSYNYLTQQSDLVQGTQPNPLKSTGMKAQTAMPFPAPVGTADSTWTFEPDADVTFLLDAANLPSQVAITLRTASDIGTFSLFLNGDLFAVGEPAIDLGTYAITSSWKTIRVPLPKGALRGGLNKLSFVLLNGAKSDANGARAYVASIRFTSANEMTRL